MRAHFKWGQLIGPYNEMSPGDISLYLPISWPHFKWGQLIGRCKEMSPGESYGQLDFISSYSWLFQMSSHWPHWKVKSSLWALPVSNGELYHKIHLVTFLDIFLLVDCFKWGLIDHKIHLVTFLFIFLLVDCFKWALIDRIVKWRIHSELCRFQMGGYIVRFTWWHFFLSSY